MHDLATAIVRRARAVSRLLIAAIVTTAGVASSDGLDAKPTTIRLTEGTNIAAAVAPDRRAIVVSMLGRLWILPMAGGVARQITGWTYEAINPAWSPSGDLIAFQAFLDDGYHIWTVRPDGTGLTQRTFGPSDDREPAWSPDGRAIAFASDRADEGSFDIWSLDLATAALTRRTSTIVEESAPDWSPDGTSIAFVENGRAIAAVDGAGTRRVLAAGSGDSGVAAPRWRPDGSDVVYVAGANRGAFPLFSRLQADGRSLTGNEDVFPFKASFLSPDELLYTADGGIRIRNLRTGGVRKVAFTADVTLDRPQATKSIRNLSSRASQPVRGIVSPRISPDGATVAFIALGDLYLVRSGRAPERMTHDLFVERDVSWSADGAALVYSSDRDGRLQIYVRNVATGREARIDTGEGAAFAGALSPDGRRLAYKDENHALHVVDVAGGGARKLADAVGNEVGGRPSWSPDGTTIAWVDRNQINGRFREGYNMIKLVDVASGRIRAFTPAAHRSISDRGDTGPAWSPDGRSLAFVMESTLWTLPLSADKMPAGAPRRLTVETADAPSWSSGSGRLLYLHEGRMKTLDVGTGDVRPFAVDLRFANAVPVGTTIVHAGRMWDGLSDRVRSDVDIVVRDDRIVAIRPHAAGRSAGVAYIDASDRMVMPGLIEMHSHPTDAQSYGARWARMYLAMGVTSQLSLAGFLPEEIFNRESAAAGRLLGPRMFVAGEALDGARISHPGTRAVTSDAQLAMEIARQRAFGVDLMKTYVQLPGRRMASVARAANAMGIPSASHYLWNGLMSGQPFTSHLSATSRLGFSQTLSTTLRSYGDVQALYTRGGIGMVHTPFVAVSLVGNDPRMIDDARIAALFPARDQAQLRRLATNPPTAAQRAEMRVTGATLAAIVRGGGTLALGTDAPGAVPAISLQLNVRGLVEGGFTPVEALRTVTSSAARLLQADGDVGTIRPGRLADLIIVSGDPLNDVRDLYNVEKVMVGGKLYDRQALQAGFR